MNKSHSILRTCARPVQWKKKLMELSEPKDPQLTFRLNHHQDQLQAVN